MKNLKNIFLGLTAMTTLAACNNPGNSKNKTANMIAQQDSTHNHEHTYACTMHPEVTGHKGDKCSKCGMELQPIHQEDSTKLAVSILASPQPIEAGKQTALSISIKENEKNVVLEEVHEMKMHLLVVKEDLSWFDHIHPEEQQDGTYGVKETFPVAGNYLLFTDYKPKGLGGEVAMKKLEVTGTSVNSSFELNPKAIATTAGYTVTLINANDLKTNQTQDLQFSVEKNAKKLKEGDFQNYLGATAHIVMIGAKDKDFLHIHPVSDKRFPIYAQTNIKKAGIYRMWAQFKIDGQVHTADFTVDVAQGEKGNDEGKHHEHQH
ncbi:heavy metal-binding domain-containing protein [Sphingobacterium anhuiense]|uniref:Heavy metal-binding domain-containing protein n=1 Tax=Sphingobacterium anhuiense TaxID=493780 RepID=A0ABW5YX86_9SPHI